MLENIVALNNNAIHAPIRSIIKKRAFVKDHNSGFFSMASDEKKLGRLIDDSIFLLSGIADGITDGIADGITDGKTDGIADGIADGKTDGKAIFPTVIEQPIADNIHIVNRIIELFM